MPRLSEKEWHDIFLKEFSKETDRASVILSVAMLDRALETVLKTHLMPSSSSEDELLERAYAPISTFGARIDLAYRIGLISAKLCRDLHTIRKVRNDFAHNITGCSFENPSVRSRVTELVRSSGVNEKFPKARQSYPDGSRGDLQVTVSWMLYYLWYLSGQVTQIKPECPLEEIYWSKDKLAKAPDES